MKRYFVPGNVTSTAASNIINQANYNNSACVCPKENNKKVLLSSNNVSYNLSTNRRIAVIINSALGGRTQYGNFGSPEAVSFLGKREGQPGGIVAPIKNKF